MASEYIMYKGDNHTISIGYSYSGISGIFSSNLSRKIPGDFNLYNRLVVGVRGNPIRYRYMNTLKSGKVTYSSDCLELSGVELFLEIEYR